MYARLYVVSDLPWKTCLMEVISINDVESRTDRRNHRHTERMFKQAEIRTITFTLISASQENQGLVKNPLSVQCMG